MDVLGERALDGLGPIRGLGDDLEVGFSVHDQLQPAAHDRVVVGNENARGEGNRHQGPFPAAGASRRTSTPPAWACLIASAAPTRTARSRMPRNPPAPPEGGPLRPRPSS